MTPEAKAREQIDAILTNCGWIVQDYKAFNPGAGPGIALREVPVKGGRCDYLLLAKRAPVGIVEAKPEGTTLSGIADQSSFLVIIFPKIFALRDDCHFSTNRRAPRPFFVTNATRIPARARYLSANRAVSCKHSDFRTSLIPLCQWIRGAAINCSLSFKGQPVTIAGKLHFTDCFKAK